MDDEELTSALDPAELEFDLATVPVVPDLSVVEPDQSGLEEWAPLDPEKLKTHVTDPLTATFSDLDLSSAVAALPVEFSEDFWTVED